MTRVKIAWLALNTTCNNRCVFCYGGQYHSQRKEMSLEQYNNVIDFLCGMNCRKVVFVGGEPTLYSHLYEAVQQAVSRGMECSIVTNGRALSNVAYLSRFHPYKDSISFTVSLEGPSLVHDTITCRPGSYDEAFAGLVNCRDMAFHVSTNTTIVRHNQRFLSEVVNDVHEHGIEHCSFNYGIPPLNIEYDPNDFLPLHRLGEVITDICKGLNATFPSLLFTSPLPFCALDGIASTTLEKYKFRISTICHVLTGEGITIDPEGNILPCTHFVDLPLANVRQFTDRAEFDHFWATTCNETFRKKLRRYPSEECGQCSRAAECTAGCPIMWLYNDASLMRGTVHDSN